MRGTRLRSKVKSAVAVLCAAGFLSVSIGTASTAVAADTWETWPKKPADSSVKPSGAADAGDAAGKSTATGLSSGTIGWIAGGAAVIIGIAVAAGGGGGGDSSTPAHH